MTNPLPPSDPICYPFRTGQTTPTVTPLGRREHIRDSLEHGDWRTAAAHLHQAHTHQEWHGCGLNSWRDYVETIPLSRMHDWRLRRTATLGLNEACYTLREAMRQARKTALQSQP